ncbi:MAG TPA: hypothetical protein VGM30_01410 [Puia sp.]|jgi:hypothetical protein
MIINRSSGVTRLTTQPDLHTVRILRPDNMPCRMTDLARLEKMPVRRAGNADRINRLSPPGNGPACPVK